MACRVISIKILVYGRQRRHHHLISPTGMDARHTMKCDIYRFNRLRNRCYRYTMFQWWYGFSMSIGKSTGNAIEPWILERIHMANEQYTVSTKQPQVTDLTIVDSWASSDIGGVWASFQVTRLFHNTTVSQCDHFGAATYVFAAWNFTTLITRWKSFYFLFLFFRGGGGGVTYLDLVGKHSTPMYLLFGAVYWSLGLRVYFGFFKCRSCISYQWFALLNLLRRCVVHFIEDKTSSYLCQSFIAAAATTVGNMWGGVKC